jgi:ABC-type nitrate/sulfonate/bicarbonate transport system permease component
MEEITRAFTQATISPMELFGWLFLGAVGLLGFADFVKHGWFKNNKAATKYIVLVLGVITAVCACPLTPQWLGIAWVSLTVVIALATIFKENVLDVVKALLDTLKKGKV